MELNDKKKITALKDTFIENSKTLTISTNTNSDYPEIGYAPFIFLKNIFYIFSSELSPHIKIILKKECGSFMVIQDEKDSKNIWSRIRMKFNGNIEVIKRTNLEFDKISNIFEERHGTTMSVIKPFTDFHLIKIKPLNGSLIVGFGKAYILDGKDLKVVEHIKN